MLKSILGPSTTGGSFRDGGRIPSMNDLSMGAGMDIDEASDQSARRTSSEFAKNGPPSAPGAKTSGNVWTSVFNPGRNPNMPKTAERFDKVDAGSPSTWEYIVKAEKLTSDTFKELDTEGHGYLTPEELGRGLHIDISQVQSLLKAADSNGDGKISYEEWAEVMRKSGAQPSSPKTPVAGAPPKGGSFRAPVQPEACPDHVSAFTSSKPEQIEASRRVSADFQRGLKEARDEVLGSSPGGIPMPPKGGGGSFKASGGGSPKAGDVWTSVFNPGRNYNMPKTSERFDAAPNGSPTTWDYIKQSEKK